MDRKDNETYLQYVKRITEMCSNKTIDYNEWGDYLLGSDNNYSSDNLRKGLYIVSKMLNKLDDSVDISSDEVILNMQNLKEEIYKEKCKLSDQRREYNKNLRTEARYEHLVEVLKETMEFLPPIKLNVCEIKNNSNIEASLLLSDFHVGLEVDNLQNYYDISVAKERLSELCSKTIKYCKLHNVNKLNLELLGDLISGCIQLQHQMESEEDTISQIITVSEIISNFINELNLYIPNIVIYGVYGNHSRSTMDKKASLPKANFERLIFKYIQLRVPNIKLIQNGFEDYLIYKVNNRKILITHGDKDTISNIKMHFCDLLGEIFDEYHLAHVHHFNIKDDNGSEIVVNGSLISTDNYAVGLRKNTKASQVLRVYGDDIVTYKLELN